MINIKIMFFVFFYVCTLKIYFTIENKNYSYYY